MENCPVFVSSTDSCSDIWPVFFNLFKINWPEYTGKIYLNTEEKSFRSDGLDIVCTRVGRLGNFGRSFRAGLDTVESDNVLLMMIDYIFMGKVNTQKVDECFKYFLSNNLDILSLVHMKTAGASNLINNDDIDIVLASSTPIFSYQMAFWKKEALYKMVLPHESQCSSVYYGCRRASKGEVFVAHLSKNAEQPIPHDPNGCLRQGKWLDNAVEYLQSINCQVNFDKRGHFKAVPQTIRKRLKARWVLIKDGLKGSYWSVIKTT